MANHYVNKEQVKAIEMINKLKCITKEQLKKTGIFKKSYSMSVDDKIAVFNKYSYDRNEKQFNVLENKYYVPVNVSSPDLDAVKCVDVMLSFNKDEIVWYSAAEYPFKLTFAKKSKMKDGEDETRIFDVAVLNKGDEMFITKVIECSPCDRIILIVNKDKAEQYKEVQTSRKLKYCVIEETDKIEELKYFNSLSDIVKYRDQETTRNAGKEI